MEYEWYRDYVMNQARHTTRTLLCNTLARLFDNRTDLSKKIFAELEKGIFAPRSSAGTDFYLIQRKDVSKCTTLNKFIVTLQERYTTMRILEECPQELYIFE
jgi:hypothetical protein